MSVTKENLRKIESAKDVKALKKAFLESGVTCAETAWAHHEPVHIGAPFERYRKNMVLVAKEDAFARPEFEFMRKEEAGTS